MASNYFGEVFRFTTWGESHGKAIGCVIDGCLPLVPLTELDIQEFLNHRKPGLNKFTTQRQEDDKVEILSGVFEGKTTGTPISLIIYNNDQKSHDYDDIKDKFRPSHADFTYMQKYGIRDYRGGGRSSARETAMRVAAGAVARKMLMTIAPEITVHAYITQIGDIKIDNNNINYDQIYQNDFFSPDPQAVPKFAERLQETRTNGLSLGAIIEVVAKNIPAGLGEPIYHKLDSEIAKAMMSINAVKSVEIGIGAECATLTGAQNADEIVMQNNNLSFLSNNAGGILGGISSGQDIIARFAVKPTSSILTPRQTVDIHGNNTQIITKGRHDPCVGIRAVPIGQAMMYCVLADAYLRRFGYV